MVPEDASCSWYGDVLADLANAFRRDGLLKSAEMLDDASLVLVEEQRRVEAQRKTEQNGLKLIVS